MGDIVVSSAKLVQLRRDFGILFLVRGWSPPPLLPTAFLLPLGAGIDQIRLCVCEHARQIPRHLLGFLLTLKTQRDLTPVTVEQFDDIGPAIHTGLFEQRQPKVFRLRTEIKNTTVMLDRCSLTSRYTHQITISNRRLIRADADSSHMFGL